MLCLHGRSNSGYPTVIIMIPIEMLRVLTVAKHFNKLVRHRPLDIYWLKFHYIQANSVFDCSSVFFRFFVCADCCIYTRTCLGFIRLWNHTIWWTAERPSHTFSILLCVYHLLGCVVRLCCVFVSNLSCFSAPMPISMRASIQTIYL